MNMRCVRLGSTLLLSMTIAFGPVVQAADQGVIHLAAAIGLESSPAPTKPPTKSSVPAKTTPTTASKPATTEQPPKESTGMSTSTKVWIGVGVAAGLALVAGGGGGSSATTHVPP
jgi:hypothetical protein